MFLICISTGTMIHKQKIERDTNADNENGACSTNLVFGGNSKKLSIDWPETIIPITGIKNKRLTNINIFNNLIVRLYFKSDSY